MARHRILVRVIKSVEAVILYVMLRKTQLLEHVEGDLFSGIAILDVQHLRLPTVVDNPYYRRVGRKLAYG